jgi:AAA domain, putative AbiEii toxin, Type IV TA system
MLQEISFKPTKNTQQLDLSLKSLACVNILVGPNGAGKSRVLRGIRSQTEGAPQSPDHDDITVLPLQIKLKVASDFERLPSAPTLFDNDFRRHLAQAFNDLDLGNLEEKIVGGHAPGGLGGTVESAPRQDKILMMNDVLVGGDNDFVPVDSTFSAGTLKLADVYSKIAAYMDRPIYHIFDGNSCFIVLIEEVETALHPAAHKKMLAALVECARNGRKAIISNPSLGDSEIVVPTQIFVTTHSPFLVSAAAEFSPDLVKVYLLQNGKTVDIKGKVGGENGYGGAGALLAANQMLGASQKDYIPSRIVLAEDSIQQFLSAAANKLGGTVDAYQASTSGDSNTCQTATTLLSFPENYLSLNQRQPWKNILNFEIFVFLDGPPQNNEKQRWENLETKYQNKLRYYEVAEVEFESCHPCDLVNNFLQKNSYASLTDGTFSNHARSKLGITCGKEIGKLKCELAKFVGENITKELLQQHYSKLLQVLRLPQNDKEENIARGDIAP